MKDNYFGKVSDRIDLKHLKCFVVCAEVGSFSKAAEIIFTTQPNISKAIKAFEENLGFKLFERKSRGILLTARGKHVYEYARKAIEDIDMLASFSQSDQIEKLEISSNPSSWLAKKFADFYRSFREEKLHFELYTCSVEEVIKRVAAYQDELGFVYVMDNQNTSFQYILSRNHLEFVELKKTQVVLFLGKEHPLYHKNDIDEEIIKNLKTVQCFEGEFDLNNYWKIRKPSGKDLQTPETVVVTNSDCVMEQLLLTTDLSNISSGYLTDEVDKKNFKEIALYEDENVVTFGYIKRKSDDLSKWGNTFMDFIIESLKEKQIKIEAK